MNDEDYPDHWKPAHVRKHEAAEAQRQAEAQQAAGAAPDETYPSHWLPQKGPEA